MSRLRDPRLRLGLAVVLLAIVGVAGYHVGVNLWTSRKYDAALQALERYDYSLAAENLESCLAFQPNNHEVLLLAAQTARRRGDFDEAERGLRLAEKHGAPAQAVATERRLALIQTGDLTDVAGLIHFCTEHPDGPEAGLILEVLIEGGMKAFRLGTVKWAVDLWLKHRPKPVDQAQGLLWRGHLSEYAQDFPQAQADYQKAAELNPERNAARLRLVEALLRNEPRQAIPHLDWLRQRAPHDPQVRYLTARLYRNLGQPEEAAPLLDALLVANPDNVPILLERGRVALDLNRAQAAEAWLQHALALAPEQREANLALADCLRQQGRLDEAKRCQDKAQEIEARLNKRLEELTGEIGSKK